MYLPKVKKNILFIFLLISSCSHLNKQTSNSLYQLKEIEESSPENNIEAKDLLLLGLESKYSSTETTWWVSYRRATIWKDTDPNLSCNLFIKLSEDKNFPLANEALLRSIEPCSKIKDNYLAGQFDWNKQPIWLQPQSIEAQFDLNQKNKDLVSQYNLFILKSKSSIIPKEKVNFVLEAIKIAKSLKDSSKIKESTDRLYKLAPRFTPSPKKEQYLEIANDYKRSRDFKNARKYYLKILYSKNIDFNEQVQALKGIRSSYKLERNKIKYEKATRNLAQFIEKKWLLSKKNEKLKLTKLHHETQITLARTLWTLDQVSNAKKVLIKMSKTLKGKYSLSEVYWLLGRMAEEKGKYAQSLWWFDKSLTEIANKKSEEFERLQWYRAWNLRKLREFDKSIVALQDLIEITQSEFSKSRYLFWLAKTFQSSGNQQEYQKNLEKLIIDDPLGYYGVLAQRELNLPIKLSKTEKSDSEKLQSPIPQSEIDYIHWLNSVRESEIANQYLDHMSDQYRKSDNPNEEGWLSIFKLYAQSGIYINLYQQLYKIDSDQRNHILQNHPELLFPTPFKNEVTKASEKFNVPAEFIYSIMRQESAFDPLARSSADAFGLMQILPDVAKQTALLNNIEFKNSDELFKPAINIPIGAAFLKELNQKFKDQFILAVASYNASEDAIYGWLRTRFRGDTLEFIEDIPYEETRSYVRLVIRNLVFYKMLTNPEQDLLFPQWALTLETH